jgi:hypothetical protein
LSAGYENGPDIPVSASFCEVLRANPDSVAAPPRCAPCGKMIPWFPRFSIIFPGIREILKSVVKSFRKRLSTRNNVKKKRRKPQTSQDKAVATNYHSRQTSGKNQNREYFTVFFGGFC